MKVNEKLENQYKELTLYGNYIKVKDYSLYNPDNKGVDHYREILVELCNYYYVLKMKNGDIVSILKII